MSIATIEIQPRVTTVEFDDQDNMIPGRAIIRAFV